MLSGSKIILKCLTSWDHNVSTTTLTWPDLDKLLRLVERDEDLRGLGVGGATVRPLLHLQHHHLRLH